MTQFKLIAGLSFASVLAFPVAAQTTQVCVAPPPLVKVSTQPIEGLAADAIGVRSNYSEITESTSLAVFSGDVEVQMGQQRLFTDNAEINQATGNIHASGATSFIDGYVNVVSDNFTLTSESNSAMLEGARYQITNTGARGKADLLEINPTELSLQGSTFTTCPTDVPAWQLSASEINLSEDDAWGEAWHAKFELFGVPVLYLPYISFPTNDERKSGLLYPTISSSSKNGFELETPYYFNIAPNMDATFTPRYMAERGLQAQGEFRYLTEASTGQFNLEYLPEDNSLESDTARYLWHVEQTYDINENIRAYANGTFISDDDYLNDFGSDFAGRADSHLYRNVRVDYVTENWHSRIRAEDFDVLGQYRSPYRTLPQLSTQYQSSNNNFSYDLYSELTHFQNQDVGNDQATRWHIEPSVNYTVEAPAYDWLAELGYAFTYYDQTNPSGSLADTTSRSLPNFRWRGRINFEREFDFGDGNFTQTLQPQIQYLYVPYKDQSDIGIYDTTFMQDDYNGLFRARRFTGLDRIADANQVTIGASTTIFDEQARELMRLSLGQIYYFEDSETTLFDESDRISSNNSDLAAELSFRFSDRWSFNGAIQYDAELNSTQKSQTAVEYRKDNDNLIQVSHRKTGNLLDEDIEQFGLQGAWSLNSEWQVASNWYYDLNNRRTNDAILGIQYSSCCWAVRVSGYRRINRNLELFQPNQPLGQPEFDNGISIQFIIKGLGNDNNSLIDMLEDSLFGYRRPFYLSN